MKITAFLFFFCFFSTFVFSQEVLLPLQRNKVAQTGTLSKSDIPIVKMPFIEDFSGNYLYPNANKFTDNYVFVSDGFAYNPISIGVATFDGLDAEGNFYAHGSSMQFAADSLTSGNIRFDSVFTGLPHRATIADSIYFSFYFQPQGLGEKPDSEDSLTLQFFAANQNIWYNVWSAEGMALSQFKTLYNADWKCVMIPILDTMFLNSGFRFRFVNYASYADLSLPTWDSNSDFWNVDYIYINNDRNQGDSLPEDLAFKQRYTTLLKDYYSMPWNQFKANSSAEMLSEISIPYANYSASLVNATENLIITDLSNSTSYNFGLSAANLSPYSEYSFLRNPIPYTYSSSVAENAEFLVQFCINTATISDLIRSNDTVSFYQRFYNYFATDDGTAEAGYGLSIDGAKLAYAFKANVPDTIRSVQFMFNKTSDGDNAIYFYLTIWDDNNGKPGNIIYSQYVLPEFAEGLQQFHNYVLDEVVPVNGIFYVGWEQTSADILNLGFDMNSDRSSKIFYNTDGSWYNSIYSGALMIRPILGSTSAPFVDINQNTDNEFSVYPNPCKKGNVVNISGLEQPSIVRIIDINGKTVNTFYNRNHISTENLTTGFYFIEIESETPAVFKLFVTP